MKELDRVVKVIERERNKWKTIDIAHSPIFKQATTDVIEKLGHKSL